MKLFLLGLALGLSGAAAAQIRLPQLPQLPRVTEPLTRALPLRELTQPLLSRTELLAERLKREPGVWMRDRQGQPVLRDRLLWIAPSEAARARAEAAGWRLQPALALDALGLQAWQVQPPAGTDAVAAQAQLQALDDEGAAELEHLYLPAGGLSDSRPGTAAAKAEGQPRLGLIDTGVDARHPALAGLRLQTLGCAPRPHAHGTAVASLLAGRGEGLQSAFPGAALAAVDIDCGEPGGSTASRLVQALALLLQAGVPVVNISLVGPPNRLLEAAVAAAQARGQLLVAAAGNEGPAAPPLYPAAYPGVLGVAATDARRRPLPESARGPQVSAAAVGAELAVAQLGEGLARARGSSFAAPWVAGRLAAAWGEGPPSVERASALRAALQAQLDDLGEPGRDPVYGWGWAGPRWRLQLQEGVKAGK